MTEYDWDRDTMEYILVEKYEFEESSLEEMDYEGIERLTKNYVDQHLDLVGDICEQWDTFEKEELREAKYSIVEGIHSLLPSETEERGVY